MKTYKNRIVHATDVSFRDELLVDLRAICGTSSSTPITINAALTEAIGSTIGDAGIVATVLAVNNRLAGCELGRAVALSICQGRRMVLRDDLELTIVLRSGLQIWYERQWQHTRRSEELT